MNHCGSILMASMWNCSWWSTALSFMLKMCDAFLTIGSLMFLYCELNGVYVVVVSEKAIYSVVSRQLVGPLLRLLDHFFVGEEALEPGEHQAVQKREYVVLSVLLAHECQVVLRLHVCRCFDELDLLLSDEEQDTSQLVHALSVAQTAVRQCPGQQHVFEGRQCALLLEQIQFRESSFYVFVDDALCLLLEGLVVNSLYFFFPLQQRIRHERVFVRLERIFHFFEELFVVGSVFLDALEIPAVLHVLEET